MLSPFAPSADRAIFEWCRALPFDWPIDTGRGSAPMGFLPAQPRLDMAGAARLLPARLGSCAALLLASGAQIAALAASLAARALALAGCARAQARALGALASLEGLSEKAAALSERLAFAGDGQALALDCYARLACHWTRSLCADGLVLGALGAPALDSAARAEALSALGIRLDGHDGRSPCERAWARALSRAWLAASDFEQLDSAFASSEMPIEWSPSDALPPYALLRRACSQLCLDPCWGSRGFEAASARGEAMASLWERGQLSAGLRLGSRSPLRPARRL